MKPLDYISSACLCDNVSFDKLSGVMAYGIAGNVSKILKVCGMGVLRGTFNCYMRDSNEKYYTSKILVPLEVYNIIQNKLQTSREFKDLYIRFVIEAYFDKKSKEFTNTCTYLSIAKDKQPSENLINEENENA